MYGTEMVDIIVGLDQILYRVHKDRLCTQVPYFANLLKKPMTSSDNTEDSQAAQDALPTLSFPQEQPDSFNIFLTWVYEGTLPTLKRNKDVTKHRGWNWDPFEGYLLAQHLNLPLLQDLIMEALRSGQTATGMLHSLDTVKTVFPRVNNHSAMQRYLGHSLLKAILSADTNKLEALYPTKEIWKLLDGDSALLMLILRYLRGMEGKAMGEPRFVKGCTYHDHDKSTMCPNDNK
jgi:hypothetical protein